MNPADRMLMISRYGLMRFNTTETFSNFGMKGLCLVRSILSDQDRSRDGMSRITIAREQRIPFASTIPRSTPILKFISTRTTKPKNVVMDEESTVFNVLFSPRFKAGILSSPSSLSLS